MTQTPPPRRTGSYTANLLGNIRSHLAGLQGYDVMALELIQNADDAKAEQLIFDITDDGLLVRNSGTFSYCGDLFERPCRFKADKNYICDYHRIVDVGSGGKLSQGDNIGRFGIGFVSTYQVTDHPQIRSSGIEVTLQPELAQWSIDPFDEPEGTSFFLPWASDPRTVTRLELAVSHVGPALIDQLAEDFQNVLRNSLLFLRHVRKAEVLRNGKLLLACNLERADDSRLNLRFRPSGEVEQWHILRADAFEESKHLYATYPRLEVLDRSTEVSIALRLDPAPLVEGLLYAFLPTGQTTGLPLHINADFFPESDRKTIIFAGHQHEQAWNEMLVEVAAKELGRDPEGLLKILGHVQFWQLLGRASALTSRLTGHPACFKHIWERLKATGAQANIAIALDGSYHRPSEVFRTGAPLNTAQAQTLLELGGRLASEDLRSYYTALGQLGAPTLTLERLLVLLERTTPRLAVGQHSIDEQRLETFYRPLWSIANDLLPEAVAPNTVPNSVMQRLVAAPFIVTEDLIVVTIDQCYLAPSPQDAKRVAELLPRLAIASHRVLAFPKVVRLITNLDLNEVVTHLSEMLASDPVADVISDSPDDLSDLYTLFAELDELSHLQNTPQYQALRSMPIWLSNHVLISANQALLPGDFTDPTGHAELLDPGVLTEYTKGFVTKKLGVETQTIEAFVQTVLPHFFNETGPLDETKYGPLITELASHPSLLNDDRIRALLSSMPIVPTQDGRWSRPTNTYRRTAELVKVLGDALHLWLDTTRLPDTRSIQSFIDALGLCRSPLAQHLVERMLDIARKSPPSDEAKRASAEAFYVLCDNHEAWKERKFFRSAIAALRRTACFPAEADSENWHTADSLYAPYRADAFRSQARILDFRSAARLKTAFLEELNVTINPDTTLVIRHLQHCVEMGVAPHISTYQVLNESAQRDDPLIATLAEMRCIYVESQKTFFYPNRLYWSPQQLGRFAFTIPGRFDSFKPLFTAIGVKNAPEGDDFADILLDIAGCVFRRM